MLLLTVLGHGRGSANPFAKTNQKQPRHSKDTLAERSKAVAQGAIPKGRGFEPHRRHFDESKLNKIKMACSP